MSDVLEFLSYDDSCVHLYLSLVNIVHNNNLSMAEKAFL